MKRLAAVVGTTKELPILVTELVHHKGLDMWLGACILVTRNPSPTPPSLQ